MIHIALDANIIASWILYHSFLQTHGHHKKKETSRNTRIRQAYTAVETVLSSEEYIPVYTPLILAEVAQVLIRERILTHAYREGIPFRQLLRGKTLYEKRYEEMLSTDDRQVLRAFLQEYTQRLETGGGRLLHALPSQKYLFYLIIQKGLDTHDAYIIATLAEYRELTLILTDDHGLKKKLPSLTIQFEDGSLKHIPLITPKEFLKRKASSHT